MRLFISISCLLFLFLGCKDTSSTINPDDTTVNDSTFTYIRDNRKYTIVKIGKQVWMSENLQTTQYNYGKPLRYAPSTEEWIDAANKRQGAWCYYDNDEQKGKLYNWYAARSLAPLGWHIPSDWEWYRLSIFLGGEPIAVLKMKSTTGWASNENGNNSSGFTALPSGYRDNDGTFHDGGLTGYWWSSSETSGGNIWYRYLGYDGGDLGGYGSNTGRGFSVRCIRD
jgi:uncharacterized protein (TIGR02145 family)